MKCLVTGGAGFIGSHLVDRLLLEGHDVLVVDDLSHGKKKNVPKGAALVRMDIRSPKLARHFTRFRPQIVFHMAAQMEVRRSVEEPIFDADVNILGLINVMQCAVQAGCPRLVFASSGGAVYGEQEVFPATENHPTRPVSPYGITKRAGELYADYYASMGLHCAAMRFANVYGPRQDPHGEAGVIAIFSEMMLGGKTPTINGNGKQTRDFVYVDDVVDACHYAMLKEIRGEFNVGTGVETDINRICELIGEYAGFSGQPTHGTVKEGEQIRSVISPAKLSTETEWEPRHSLEAGLKETVEWFRQKKR